MYPAILARSHPAIPRLAEEVVPSTRPTSLAELQRLLSNATLRTIQSKTIDRDGYVRECRRAIAEFLIMGAPQ
jgi:hypothetical protein